MYSREIYEIYKNTYFQEHLWTTASGVYNPVKHLLLSKSVNGFHKNQRWSTGFLIHVYADSYHEGVR